MPALAACFLDRWRGAESPGDDLEVALTSLWESGRDAWPEIPPLSPESLAAWVGARAPIDRSAAVAARSIDPRDAYLACGCSLGIPEAIRAFDAKLLSNVSLYVRRLRLSDELVDETRRALLDKLFVGTNGQKPKIVQYRGPGSLEGWVRVAAIRTASNLLAASRPKHAAIDDAAAVAAAIAPACDPELELVKAGYRSAFIEAFREAMGTLEPRERALLRFVYVEQMTPARIGVIYGAHRTTATRWLEAAHAKVLARTEALLVKRLGIARSECARLFQLVKSRLDVTLTSLLRAEP